MCERLVSVKQHCHWRRGNPPWLPIYHQGRHRGLPLRGDRSSTGVGATPCGCLGWAGTRTAPAIGFMIWGGMNAMKVDYSRRLEITPRPRAQTRHPPAGDASRKQVATGGGLPVEPLAGVPMSALTPVCFAKTPASTLSGDNNRTTVLFLNASPYRAIVRPYRHQVQDPIEAPTILTRRDETATPHIIMSSHFRLESTQHAMSSRPMSPLFY